MPNIKPVDQIARKFARVTPGRQQDFEEGVKNPSRDWAQNTKAAEDSYKAGVTKAANEGRFGRGVAKAGTAKWQANTITKGVGRWAEGVATAEDSYREGFAPYADVIQRTDIGPRYPKGDARNFDRVRKLGLALHAAKTGR